MHVREATGFRDWRGAASGFGNPTARMFIDPDLAASTTKCGQQLGTWNDVFPIDPKVLQRAASGVVVDLRRVT